MTAAGSVVETTAPSSRQTTSGNPATGRSAKPIVVYAKPPFGQALELYDAYHAKVAKCDLRTFPPRDNNVSKRIGGSGQPNRQQIPEQTRHGKLKTLIVQ